MNKIATLIANGEITVEELANAQELIDRAEIVNQGLEACKKTIMFPLGVCEIDCYSYTDSDGEYNSWGSCTNDGTFTCYCNWGGDHIIGKCNLKDFVSVFMAFEKHEFVNDLRRFLLTQISKAN